MGNLHYLAIDYQLLVMEIHLCGLINTQNLFGILCHSLY